MNQLKQCQSETDGLNGIKVQLNGPRREKTCLWGVRQKEFQTSLARKLKFHLKQVYI